MDNAKKRTDDLMETGPVICGRCHRPLEHFVIEEIHGFKQLRCADVLIREVEMDCLHCGWTFHWNIRKKDIERMATEYGKLVLRLTSYNPE